MTAPKTAKPKARAPAAGAAPTATPATASELAAQVSAQAMLGISGINCSSIINMAASALDIPAARTPGAALTPDAAQSAAAAGGPQLPGPTLAQVVEAARARDDAIGQITRRSGRLGDRAAREAWTRACWLGTWEYLVTPFPRSGRGLARGRMAWREGREAIFGEQYRSLPLVLDSGGYSRVISGSAQDWVYDFENYVEAVELVRPNGFAAFDHPNSREQTLEHLRALERLFPNDPRLWPVFSSRWVWDEHARISDAQLPPGWGRGALARLVPFTRTQMRPKEAVLEAQARLAVANACRMAHDPDFLRMVRRHGCAMVGGLAQGPCARLVRHLFLGALALYVPEVRLWGLGQSSAQVVNGLGWLGLIDRVYSDGSGPVLQARAERSCVIEHGLITAISMGTSERDRHGRTHKRQLFFTFGEMLASNVRALLAGYLPNAIAWPKPVAYWPADVELSPPPADALAELRPHYQAAQLEMALALSDPGARRAVDDSLF